MSIPTLTARAQRLQQMASELGPQLQAIATTGSMLERAYPDAADYLTELQQEVIERTRAFGALAQEHGRDLKTVVVEDVTLAYAWHEAKIEPPPESDWALIDRALELLLEHGQQLTVWEFSNPNWRRFAIGAVIVTALASAAVAATTVALVLTGGVAAVAAVPLIVASAGTQIADAAATIALVVAG